MTATTGYDLVRPPLVLALGAAALAALSLGTAMVHIDALHWVGYVAACLALLAGGQSKREDARRRLRPEYAGIAWFGPVVIASGIAALVGLLANTWPLATELAR